MGAIVRISMRGRTALAIVVADVPKPAFAVKPITAIAPFAPLPAETLELLDWLRAYYPAPLGAVVRQFLPPTTIFPKLANSQTRKLANPLQLPPLTAEQSQALKIIEDPGSFLLHGITGSGKSRVYVELAQRSLAAGKSAIILTPEIGLTAQLTDTFRDTFGKHVYVLHSQLTAAKRRNVWYELLSQTTPVVVIGPRSALFSPLRDIGLIVLDEGHDNAYKNESAPHYHAGRVAAKLAMLHGATFVSGSATPAVEDYFVALEKQRPIVNLHELAKTNDTNVVVKTVDLKDRSLFSRSSLFSNELLQTMSTALDQGEQTLLFLNRRGTANVVLCSVCGWQTLCPNCDLPLTYHGDEHQLRCHICGFADRLPSSCPVCNNTDILLKSVGTKAVLDEVQRLFPGARTQRFDTDLHKDERLEQHMSAVQAGDVDILVGTQILAKGLDLPRLSVVGIVSADSSLLIPDYTAAEHTYQLISQVTGRVGRGHRNSTVVLQTYDPLNPTIQAAVNRQWQQFYDLEIAERKAYRFPPFCYLLKLNCLRATSQAAEKAAQELTSKLAANYPGLTIEGPTPAFHPRERGKYNWQMVIKASRRSLLVDIIGALPSGWSYDIDPVNLL